MKIWFLKKCVSRLSVKFLKKTFVFAAVACIMSATCVSSSATEMLSGRRWCFMSTGSSGSSTIYRCDLTISYEKMLGMWNKPYSETVALGKQAIDIWKNNSNGIMNTSVASFSSAKLDLISYQGDNWIYTEDVHAFTSIVDKSGNVWNDNETEDSVSASKFGNRIKAAYVIFNPYIDPTMNGAANRTEATKNLLKVVIHEIGHCVNLGHPSGQDSAYVPSVMHSGWKGDSSVLNYNNYPYPTSRDKTCLSTMYDRLYS